MQSFTYFSPTTVPELCDLCQITGSQLIAGGTDLLPQLHRNKQKKIERLIDLTQLKELAFIRQNGEQIEIGSLATFAEIQRSSLLITVAPALVQAAGWVGAPMTRWRATIGGNIANASPAGDSLPPLLVFGAQVHLFSSQGERVIPLQDFLISPGKTTLGSGEFIHHISFPCQSERQSCAFLKIGPRKGMTISIASVAVRLSVQPDGAIQQAKIALGSVAPTAFCPKQAEEYLTGQKPTSNLWDKASLLAAHAATPIDDVRASKNYRFQVVKVIVYRALQQAYDSALQGVHLENH